MKSTLVKVFNLLGLVSMLTGCVSPNGQPDNTGTGALVGGATGATIGALADRRNPGAGALIGGAAGAITGGLVGHSVDEQNAARAQYYSSPPPVYYAPAPQPQPLAIADIKSMARAGVSDDNIISQINSTRTVYHLDANAIIDLKNSGVSERVISTMIDTSSRVVGQPAPQAAATAASPGPGYAWVNGEWSWTGSSWVWISGRWVVAPSPRAVWVSARWEYGPYGWHWAPGHWR